MVAKGQLVPKIGLCNIHLCLVDAEEFGILSKIKEGIADPSDLPEIGEYVWICGLYGYEGVLNDGDVVYWDRELNGLLKKIAAHPKDVHEKKTLSQIR